MILTIDRQINSVKLANSQQEAVDLQLIMLILMVQDGNQKKFLREIIIEPNIEIE